MLLVELSGLCSEAFVTSSRRESPGHGRPVFHSDTRTLACQRLNSGQAMSVHNVAASQ